jgi:hypothetical protein
MAGMLCLASDKTLKILQAAEFKLNPEGDSNFSSLNKSQSDFFFKYSFENRGPNGKMKECMQRVSK